MERKTTIFYLFFLIFKCTDVVGKTIDNGKNGHKILKLAGNVGTDDI
jgi:hypothetical protein